MIKHRSRKQVRAYDMFKLVVTIVLVLLLVVLWFTGRRAAPTVAELPAVTATSTPRPTDTPEPPTATPVPTEKPTATPVPPTATPEPAVMPEPVMPAFRMPGFDLEAGQAVTLTGTGEPGGTVEIVLDGDVIGTAPVDADGNWAFDANLPDAGTFSLGLRSLGADGALLAEAEPVDLTLTAPPMAEQPGGSDGGASMAGDDSGEAYVVQAGDWLSKLAEKHYGDPLAYPVIVDATNAKAAVDDSFTLITNPDVIEIGQKLWIPAAAQ